MEMIFKTEALLDLNYWKRSGNVAVQKRIQTLLKKISENPYIGIGKPELLKYDLSGYWSRRINNEHRIIYKVYEDRNTIEIHSLKGHYNDK